MGMGVEFFDDLNALLDKLNRDSAAADLQVKPWQAVIKLGDYFSLHSRLGFNSYGEILKEEERGGDASGEGVGLTQVEARSNATG